ncbi:MAG TPA: hypothetical protein VMM18_16490 [Gemmatimonadaceae bacterium]|nr:hypothetical protein [Gemmatimonadaceae bacterium]
MRRLLVLTAILLLPACTDGPFHPNDPARELIGTYWAESVDGLPIPHRSHSFLGAELRLRADGTFSEWWMLVNDTYAYHGRWRLVRDEIRFTVDGEYLESAYIYGRRLELWESGIVYVREQDWY